MNLRQKIKKTFAMFRRRKKKPVISEMPKDPKDLARAMFAVADMELLERMEQKQAKTRGKV